MDILNWLRIKKENLIRTTLDSPQDLLVFGADVSFQKRGDKYQSYAMPAEDFLALSRSYKVYTALLTQSGTNAPVATVLQNNIGNISFSYISAGLYYINSSNLFLNNKTWYSILANKNGTTGHAFNLTYIDSEKLLIEQNVANNDLLSNTPIEIRVYN
jgi:hypothetical protein